MIIRKLDASHDWTFGRGLGNYATDELAIEENVNTRLLSWLNDCFFAPNEGVDWRGRLDVGQQSALKQELKSVILKSYGVISVDSIDFVFTGRTRAITITYTITTFFSPSFTSRIQQAA